MERSGEKRPKPRGAGNFGATPVRAAQMRRRPPASPDSGRARGAAKPASLPVPSPDQSGVLGDRLLVVIWPPLNKRTARTGRTRALAAKNQVTASYARLLEVASMHSRPRDIP